MALRIYIFERDQALLKLLTHYLQSKGHQVIGFADQYSCPLYAMEACACPAETRCADALIINTRIPTPENLQILLDQDRKGCKLPKLNKAVMSALMTDAHEQEIRQLGFFTIKKPFRLSKVSEWLEACACRLTRTG